MKNLRFKIIFFLILFFSLTLVFRLYFLQVKKSQYYQALAQGQHKILKRETGERGKIYFRGGEILATNKKEKFLYICPKEIKEKEKIAKLLSEVLNLPLKEMKKKVFEENCFQLIKNRVSEKEFLALKDLKGVYFGQKDFRFYPQKEIACHIVGFVNAQGKGQYGIEGYYDNILRGKEVLKEKLLTPWKYLAVFAQKESKKGKDIFLTIDYNIQFQAEKLLREAKEKLKITEGQIIVSDPNTGEILAMASFPSFDPNRFFEYAQEEKWEIFKNPNIQELYEPGSVLKPIVMAGALNEGKITSQMTFFDKGFVKIEGKIIRNWQNKIWGESSMSKILEKSINTGAVFVEQKLGERLFLEYLKRFGFFEKTGIDLEGEVFSENEQLMTLKKINLATASFGQGIVITPIQLVRAYGAIANGGKLIKPRITKGEIEIQNPRVISETVAKELTKMLVNVVEKGYGKRAKIPGYFIAGKTGTAQIPWPALGIKKAGYSDKTIHSFLGFFPAYDPKFLIYVKLNEPKGVIGSGLSATLIFKKLAKYIIAYKEIPPDYE